MEGKGLRDREIEGLKDIEIEGKIKITEEYGG